MLYYLHLFLLHIIYSCNVLPHSLHTFEILCLVTDLLAHAVLSELYQEMLVTEDEVKRMNVEEEEISDRLVLVQCTKSPKVGRTADVLDKYGHKEEASLLRGWWGSQTS